MIDFARLLQGLRTGQVEFIVRLKRAAGRPRDLKAVAELEALWQERQSLDS